MALTPLLIAIAPRAAALAERILPARLRAGRSGPGTLPAAGPPHEGHVIIIGYGLNGRNLARVLERERIPYVVVEMNPETVRIERAAGRPIIYGDATREEILRHAGLERARVVVIAISDAAATRSAVAHIHRFAPHVHIVVRTRYVQEVKPLLALGTSEVVPEEFETAVELLARVLRRYDIPEAEIEEVAREIRADGYELFREPEKGKRETGNGSAP
jgi:CPA2 family monovalent cation:H+ antiporter-2